jgi:hypothetical protein
MFHVPFCPFFRGEEPKGSVYRILPQDSAHININSENLKIFGSHVTRRKRRAEKWNKLPIIIFAARRKLRVRKKVLVNLKRRNNTMAKKTMVPEAKTALERFKMEAAGEVGVNLKDGYNGDLTSKQAGSVGGQMVKKMIEHAEKNMK